MTVILYEDDQIIRNIGHECASIKGMARFRWRGLVNVIPFVIRRCGHLLQYRTFLIHWQTFVAFSRIPGMFFFLFWRLNLWNYGLTECCLLVKETVKSYHTYIVVDNCVSWKTRAINCKIGGFLEEIFTYIVKVTCMYFMIGSFYK